MRTFDRFAVWLRGWFRPRIEDEVLHEELGFHIDRQIQANIEAGMTSAQARRAAQLAVGSVQVIHEESREGRPGAFVRQVVRDLSYGRGCCSKLPGLLQPL